MRVKPNSRTPQAAFSSFFPDLDMEMPAVLAVMGMAFTFEVRRHHQKPAVTRAALGNDMLRELRGIGGIAARIDIFRRPAQAAAAEIADRL